MRTHEASSTPCALTRSLRPFSGMARHAALMLCPHATRDRAAVRPDAYKIVPRITHVDRAIIHSYFRQHDFALLRQPADKETGPAGLRRKLLPADLESKLSVLPAGYQRVLVGGDVLLIETVTHTAIDVLKHAYATN